MRKCLAAVLTVLVSTPTFAGTIQLGRIEPAGLSAGGPSGLLWDQGSLLVIDAWGTAMWRLDSSDAHSTASYPLTSQTPMTRGLIHNPIGAGYYTTTRGPDPFLPSWSPLLSDQIDRMA